MDAGQLVPDEVVNGLVAGKIMKKIVKRFYNGWFPRTVVQAKALDEMTKLGKQIEKL